MSLNAFKIKNPAVLAALSMEEKRRKLYSAVGFAMAMPGLLAKEFEQQVINKFVHNPNQAIKDPTFEQFKNVVKANFGPKEGTEAHAKWATSDANPYLTTATGLMTSWFHELPSFDMGYLSLFKLIDLRGTNQPAFDINTTSAGITWSQRNEGDRTPVRREFAEGHQSVPYLEFTAAIGILDTWLQFNQFYKVEEVVNEFIAASYAKRASLHYSLLTGQSTGIDEAFATDDATTFNNACSTIIQACKAKGYNIGTNPQFDILVDTKRVGRVLAMLEATRGSLIVAFGTQDQPVAHMVRNIIVSPELSVSGTGYYLVLPERKLQRGEWLDMQIESERDITASAATWHGKEQYNAVIGDTSQVRRVKFS